MSLEQFLRKDDIAGDNFYAAKQMMEESFSLISEADSVHDLVIKSLVLLNAGRKLAEVLNRHLVSDTRQRIERIDVADMSDLETRKVLLARRIHLEDCMKDLKRPWRMTICSGLTSDEIYLRESEDGIVRSPTTVPTESLDDDPHINALLAELGGRTKI